MIDTYPLRVRENILPRSIASKLPDAFDEWFFTEEIYDHENLDGECELCNKEELRYHFRIENKFTKNKIWVGSQCILKFGLSVYDNDRLLNKKDAEKKLKILTKKMQLESCINALEKISNKENSDILKNALKYYKVNKCLTPKYAFVVFWRMQERAISYQASFFKITLRKQKYKDDLRKMSDYKVHKFWKALSSSQKEVAQKMGHTAPL